MNLPRSISPSPLDECLPEKQEPALENPEREAALNRFAKNLLAKTENSPQEVVEVLNRHFWDLV